MIRARWGKKSEAILRKEGYHNSNGKPDDTSARIKYMEEHLSNDKHYVPYDERHKTEEEQKALARKQSEQVDNMKPLIVVISIVAIIVFVMYQLGAFNAP
jgi:hypothetical protein